eukprot:TRINITY_DN834_c0_g2_i1.p2 TRINITY_DN834_c0_g2~~TRINITY_DN834_c0_g2_i1.p2  ORF type:complete len:532 (-),score=90.27 TRINITY_DN834_c0_g2_i1:10066-11661(-)
MWRANDTADVLIVGAGPTGLVLAIELARRNISLRLIDSKPYGSDTTRSFTIHARTMEMFDDMAIGDKFLQVGYKLYGFVFNFHAQNVRPKLDCRRLDSPFPFILSLGQTETERIMREHLANEYGVQVEWGTELLRLVRGADDEAYSALLRSPDGSEHLCSARWIAGCDGSRSAVRREAGLELEGGVYADTVMQLMDAPVSGFEWAEDAVHYYMSKDNFLLLARLPNQLYRVIVSFKGSIDDNDKEKARELFQDVIDSLVDDVQLREPNWVSKWNVEKKQATKYMHKNVLLVGDAAHVHSPSGGQGMNCGMQDAYNIGWKLAMVLSARCSQRILASYESERKPIGAQVIAGSDAIHQILMAHGKQLTERMKATQQAGWHHDAVQRISGLSYHYGDSSTAVATTAPLAVGQRVADVNLSGVRLHELLCGTHFTLLLVGAGKRDCEQLVQEARDALTGLLRVVAVARGGGGGDNDGDARDVADRSVSDEQGILAARLRTEGATALMVRPDGYVGARAALPEAHEVRLYIRELLT